MHIYKIKCRVSTGLYHVRRLELWVFIERRPSKAPLKDLDEVENQAGPDLHQRGVLLDDLHIKSGQRNYYYQRIEKCKYMNTGRDTHKAHLLNDVFCTHYLVVSKPYPIVCDGECEDVVDKRLTLRMVAWSGKRLQQKNTMSTTMTKLDVQPTQLSNKLMLVRTSNVIRLMLLTSIV